MKFLCTADWHLGYRQYGLVAREEDFKEAAFEVIKAAKQNNFKYILNGGDLIHHMRPTSQCVKTLVDINKKLEEFGIIMIYTRGNHDNTRPHWIETIGGQHFNDTNLNISQIQPGIALLENVRVTFSDDTTLTCIPEVDHDTFKKLTSEHPICKQKSDILLTHQSVVEFIGFKSDKAYSIVGGDFNPHQFPCVVVGDTHIAGVEETTISGNRQIVISPGSTQMVSSSEPIMKSYVSLDTENLDGCEEVLFEIQRKTFKVILDSEDTKDEKISDLKKTLKNNKKALVFLKFNSDIDIVEVLKNLNFANSDHIFRYSAIKTKSNSSNLEEDDEIENVEIVDIVEKEIENLDYEDPPFFSLVQTAFEADADFETALTDFINFRKMLT